MLNRKDWKTMKRKLVSLVITVMCALGISLIFAPSALADEPVLWNDNLYVTAKAANADYITDKDARIDVVMHFKRLSYLNRITNEEVEDYLQNNISIGGMYINRDDHYRGVYNTVVDSTERTISFSLTNDVEGPNSIFNGVLRIYANSDDNILVANCMDYFDVQTIITSGVVVEKINSSSNSATFQIKERAKNRGMVHFLILDNGSPVFSHDEIFGVGEVSISVNSFISQLQSDIAGLLCQKGNQLNQSTYTFSHGLNGLFTISSATKNCSNIEIILYDGDYLNKNKLAVGEIA